MNTIFRIILTFNSTSLILIVYLIRKEITINGFNIHLSNLPAYISYFAYILIPLPFENRAYDSRTGRWYSLDPLATKYPSYSPFIFVANSPLMFIDPDGKKIVGATRKDAERYQNQINQIFGDKKFDNVRSLFTRGQGKGVNRATFDVIKSEDLEKAIEKLSDREKTLVKEYATAINAEKTITIRYVAKGEQLDSKEYAELNKYLNDKSTPDGKKIGDLVRQTREIVTDKKDASGQVIGVDRKTEYYYDDKTIQVLGGSGFTIQTQDGAKAYVLEGSNDEEIISGHETLGHGIPILIGASDSDNNNHAVRTENLIREVGGKGNYIDGTKHGDGTPTTNPMGNP